MLEAAAAIMGPVILAAVIWLLRLPKALSENTNATTQLNIAVESMTTELKFMHNRMDRNERRHEVTQKLVSDILDHPVDTSIIADDYSKYPPKSIFHKRRTI